MILLYLLITSSVTFQLNEKSKKKMIKNTFKTFKTLKM